MTRPLPEVLASIGGPRLLVVGDLLLDRYLTGAVERVSPEAPIPVLRIEEEVERFGGAGSVAVNLAALGSTARLLGVTGDDAGAGRLAVLARAAGVELDAVTDASRRTSVKTRHLAHSHTSAQQVLRVDQETVAPLSPEVETALRGLIEPHLDAADGVCISDYGKGVVTPGLLSWLLDACRRRSVAVLVDPKGHDYARYRGATALTPNRNETRLATGIDIGLGDLAAAERAAGRLLDDLGLGFVLVTLDREGMYLKAAGAPGRHLPTTPREVFDVTGAGDMVLSVLALAIASGADPLEAAALANVAAGLEVERLGVVPVTRDEIRARLASGVDAAGSKHVHSSADATALAARLRAAGRRIVFTNGCFDVLHAGHVAYLQEARARGDVLIVGLNDDASVRRLKGDERPINTVSDRVRVLAGLSAVDYIVVFTEDTPAAVVEAIQPDVLAKGADWAGREVVGREVVEARGGEVVLIDLLEGRSTTGVIGKIRGADEARGTRP